MKINVLEFDAPLSNYYSSIHGYLDHFSIRIDEDVYTNIKGGIGVFGATRNTVLPLNFREDYLSIFGY